MNTCSFRSSRSGANDPKIHALPFVSATHRCHWREAVRRTREVFMTSLSRTCSLICWLTAFILILPAATARTLAVAVPDRNVILQWNKVAEDTIAPKTFQNEGLIYMAYVSAAIYDATIVITGGYEPYGLDADACASGGNPRSNKSGKFSIDVHPGASVQAAVATAAYETLLKYFPGDAATLNARYAEALAAISADPSSKQDGIGVGHAVARQLICLRASDNLPPFKQSSTVDHPGPGPGVWRLTPPYALPQTPWVGSVTPFVLHTVDQFRPAPPPPLTSPQWAAQFNEVKL